MLACSAIQGIPGVNGSKGEKGAMVSRISLNKYLKPIENQQINAILYKIVLNFTFY